MDFVEQIGSEVFLSVNVGSGTVAGGRRMARISDRRQADDARQGARGKRSRAPYKIKYLGLGNENWGCGGAMRPEHYVEELKRYAHYSRN